MPFAEVVDLPLAVLFFKVLGPTINPCLAVGEYPVNQTAKIVRHWVCVKFVGAIRPSLAGGSNFPELLPAPAELAAA